MKPVNPSLQDVEHDKGHHHRRDINIGCVPDPVNPYVRRFGLERGGGKEKCAITPQSVD